MTIILVDMDDVIADAEGHFLDEWRRRHPDSPSIALEDRRTWGMERQYPAEFHDRIHEVWQSSHFFLGLLPISGAREALMEMRAARHEVFICTAPYINNRDCASDKYAWAEFYLGAEWPRRLIIAPDKTLVSGDFLIDDKPEITGCRQPDWQHVIFDRPYNREVTDKPRLKNWPDWRTVLGL